MPFVKPVVWKFNELVPAGNIQIYSDNLVYFRDSLIYLPHMAGSYGQPDGRTVTHVYTYRYLVYRSRSSGDTPTMWLHGKKGDENFTSSLPGGEDDNILDLETIPWLVDGMIYVVDDVRYAFETD